MLLSCVLLSLIAPQEPAPAVPAGDPRFCWPPVAEQPIRYRVVATKERAVDRELAVREKALRQKAGRPVAADRQSVKLQVDVALRCAKDAIDADYATTLLGRPQLRWALGSAGPAPAAPPPAFGNDCLDVWGAADSAATKPRAVARASVERAFAAHLPRDGHGRAERHSFAADFGDHLLPVLWDRVLPCWVEHMAAVVELDGEAAITGKTLIRDGSGAFPLGHRQTRVELGFDAVSSTRVAIRYRMQIRQTVDHTRDLAARVKPPWEWRIDVDGKAVWDPTDGAFAEVHETVVGRPDGMDDTQLLALRDESFEGTIEVVRIRDEKPKRRGGR